MRKTIFSKSPTLVENIFINDLKQETELKLAYTFITLHKNISRIA